LPPLLALRPNLRTSTYYGLADADAIEQGARHRKARTVDDRSPIFNRLRGEFLHNGAMLHEQERGSLITQFAAHR